MTNPRLVAYVLIGLGTITLLARLSGGAGWLWIGLVAAAMLFAYARQRTYGLLVLGGILGGTAVGILLQEMFRIEAIFLVSLGAGIAAIDLVERRANRWPRTLGAILAALGVLIGLQQAGAFASVWFALLLIAAGVAIIMRGTGPSSFPPPRSDAPRAPAGSPLHTPPPASPPPGPHQAGPPPPGPTPEGRPPPGPPSTESAQRDPFAPGAHAEPGAAAPSPTPSPAPHPGPEGAPSGAPEGGTPVGTSVAPDRVTGGAPDRVTGGAPEAVRDDGSAERRARLEAWRQRSAERDAKAPQSVLSDEILDELATLAPADLSALAAVRGIGPVKLERYGPELIAVLHEGRG